MIVSSPIIPSAQTTMAFFMGAEDEGGEIPSAACISGIASALLSYRI
jgi:hypothetical protein